jgi:hypothetical protein
MVPTPRLADSGPTFRSIMEKKTKKKNPQDSTLRNVRAVNKRLKRMEQESGKTGMVLLSHRVDIEWLKSVIGWLMASGVTQIGGTYGFPEYPKTLLRGE